MRGAPPATETAGSGRDRIGRPLDGDLERIILQTESRPYVPSPQGEPMAPSPSDQADTCRAAVARSRAGSFDQVGPDARAQPALVMRQQFIDSGVLQSNLILFETDQSQILPPSEEILMAIGSALRSFPDVRIRVEGHTDYRGSAEYDLLLSRRRAEAVRRFLIDRVGLAPDEVEAVGYGESQPLIDGQTATRIALNRRVTFRVLNPEALQITKPVLPEE